jgi:hypothetical protein
MQNDEERGTEKTWGTHLQRDLFFFPQTAKQGDESVEIGPCWFSQTIVNN